MRTEGQAGRLCRIFRSITGDWFGALRDPWDLLPPVVMTGRQLSQIRRASAAVAHLYERIFELLRSADRDVTRGCGVPDPLEPVCRLGLSTGSLGLARADFVETPHGLKLLELNTDLPGLLLESLAVNRVACKEYGLDDPNAASAVEMRVCFRRMLRAARAATGAKGVVAFTTPRGARPEEVTVRYLMALTPRTMRPTFVPLDRLDIRGNGIFDGDGRRISVLVRWFRLDDLHNPWELDANRRRLFLSLVCDRRFGLINPPSAYLLESKVIQALIWGLYEFGLHFNERERDWVRTYMLPTYLEEPKRGRYVHKFAYGHEGDGVFLSRRRNRRRGLNAVSVFQKRMELPRSTFVTELGPRRLHKVISCVLAGSIPTAVSMRAGRAITDANAWYVPVGLRPR